MAIKGIKFIISLALAVVLILNFSVPVVYAVEKAADKIEPVQYCNLFCNLSPSMAKDGENVSCPHHLREIKKKRLTDHFQCRICPADCHDNTSNAQASSSGDPYLLSKYPQNQNITVSLLNFNYSTILSQTVISFLERPPSKLYS